MKIPGVTHTVVARKIKEWPNRGAKSRKEAIEKRRLRELLDAKTEREASPATGSSFDSVFRPRLRPRLPLHVGRAVNTAAG